MLDDLNIQGDFFTPPPAAAGSTPPPPPPPVQIDWNDPAALKELGVPPVLPDRLEPTQRGHSGHSRGTDAANPALAGALASAVDPLALAIQTESVDLEEEAARDAAAARHAQQAEWAARVKEETRKRTLSRYNSFRRAAAAAGQSVMFTPAETPIPDAPAQKLGDLISDFWGAWDWRHHGFWLKCHATPGPILEWRMAI